MLLGRVWSGLFKKKLGSIVNGVRTVRPFCRQCPIVLIETPKALAISEIVSMPAFTKTVKSALQSVSFSNIADGYRCQRQAVAGLEAFLRSVFDTFAEWVEAGFDVLLTTDKNLIYRQYLKSRKIAIVVLGSNR